MSPRPTSYNDLSHEELFSRMAAIELQQQVVHSSSETCCHLDLRSHGHTVVLSIASNNLYLIVTILPIVFDDPYQTFARLLFFPCLVCQLDKKKCVGVSRMSSMHIKFPPAALGMTLKANHCPIQSRTCTITSSSSTSPIRCGDSVLVTDVPLTPTPIPVVCCRSRDLLYSLKACGPLMLCF